MKDTWKKLFKKIEPQKGLMSIGLGDVLGSGLSAFFWFYIAAILTPEFKQIKDIKTVGIILTGGNVDLSKLPF